MNTKPVPKRETSVDAAKSSMTTILNTTPSARFINFYSLVDNLCEFALFGNIWQEPNIPDTYSLIVDEGYVYEEVLAYIKAYG